MTAARVPVSETRGTLAYMVGYEVRVFQGWVRRDGDAIIARRYRGRNRWRLTRVDAVATFTPHDAAAAVEVPR